MKSETADEKYTRMIETPVKKLICTLAIPTMIGMLITSIYNMADTFFVGKIGTSATGAVGIAFALMAIIQSIGFTFGMGSGNYIARLLGNKRRDYASKVVATGFITAFLIGIVLAIIGTIFIKPIVYILGATDTIYPYARSYVQIILIGMPYMMACFVMNNILRFQGSAFHAMLGIGLGGLLNIILDPIFIFRFDMGVAGAALSTIISQLVSFFILFHYCRIKGNIKIEFKNFTPKWTLYKEILRGGLPSFYRQGLASVSTMILNLSAGIYGDAAIAAMSIVTRVFMFAGSAVIGFGQGFQPVCGFNYGAKKYDRVLKAFWFSVKVSAVFLICVSALGIVFAPNIISVFRKEDLDVINIGSAALKFQCISFPFASWIIITNMLLQTIGKSFKASVAALSRQGIFFIPAIIIFPRIFGLTGIEVSQTIADICSFLLILPMGISVIRELKDNYRQTYK
ncbi:MATE family efflux transporter [Clostridium sp. BJN0001]|uniref:MATE family efflux transporter n=1 Tax=Clostridium sp. BJN0001 TaxID=2930219 RepID=UPI001FD292A8|nr:MATE family efflux transporter [Clostridium sp. BJN0001]